MKWPLTRVQTACIAVGGALLLWIGVSFHNARQVNVARQGCSRIEGGKDRAYYLRAIEACSARVEMARDDADRADAHTMRGFARRNAQQFGQAIQDFDSALKLAPDDERALYHRATTHADGGEMQLALKDFEAILRRNPDSVPGLMGRGTVYLVLRQPDKAVTDLDRAVQLAPRDAEIHRNLGGAYLARNEPEWALKHADTAIGLAAKLSGAHLVRAGSLRRLGRLEEAMAAFDRTIALEPGDMRAYFQRGDLNFQLKRYAQAVADTTRLLEQDQSPRLLNRRCWHRAVWGRELEEALADCNAALAGRADAAILDSRGLVRYRLGDYRGAVADFSDALKLNADLETALYVRGLAKRKLGDISGGDRDITVAKARNIDVARDFDEMGVTP